MKTNREAGGLTYRDSQGKIGVTPPVWGPVCSEVPQCSVNPSDAAGHLPRNATIVADWHTHGASATSFSIDDVRGINAAGAHSSSYAGGYVGGADGGVFFYPANAMGDPITYERIGFDVRFVGTVPH